MKKTCIHGHAKLAKALDTLQESLGDETTERVKRQCFEACKTEVIEAIDSSRKEAISRDRRIDGDDIYIEHLQRQVKELVIENEQLHQTLHR